MSEKIKCPNCDGLLEKKSFGYYPIFRCNKCKETVSILEGKMFKRIEALEKRVEKLEKQAESMDNYVDITESEKQKC